jgi:hypothetical protein
MTTSRALNTYLRSEYFKRRLAREYAAYEILSEAGLRTSVARALRSKLRKMDGTASQYRVACKTHLPETNVVPDILIWKGKHPRICELKDTGTFNEKRAQRDWHKLQEFCAKYRSIKAGYFIYVARTGKKKFQIKRTRKTLHFWAIPIILQECMPGDFEEWAQEYKRRAHYTEPERAAARAASG